VPVRLIYWFTVIAIYILAGYFAVIDNKVAAFLAVVISLSGLLFGLYRFSERDNSSSHKQ